MKKLSLIVLLLTAIFSLSALSKNEESSSNELLVYCYDSFASEWGPGPAIVQAF
jgi:ABC-type thiamine transport system substrate-binding protein